MMRLSLCVRIKDYCLMNVLMSVLMTTSNKKYINTACAVKLSLRCNQQTECYTSGSLQFVNSVVSCCVTTSTRTFPTFATSQTALNNLF
uniref:Secreted protein n=1 Tax=Strongyloides venezuelensis TaxID=75913 RepID=A0A0K0FSB3_STRVS